MQQYIPAIITLVGTIVSALVSLAISLVTTSRSNDKNQAVFEERLANLTEEVHKHNNIVERTYKLEAKTDVIETKIENIEATLK